MQAADLPARSVVLAMMAILATLAALSSAPLPPTTATPPTFEITSEVAWPAFGDKIAADGPRLLVTDISASDRWSPVLRFFATSADRLLDQARFELRRGAWPIAIDISSDRAVAQLDSKQLVFFEVRRQWTQVQTLELAGRCRDSYQFLDLADDVVAIGALETICVYERTSGTWSQTAELPLVSGLDKPLTNGDRIAQHGVRPEGIRITRKTAGAWQIERELAAPDDRYILRFAISKRWLAVTFVDAGSFENPEIHLYALGAMVLPVAILRPQSDDPQFGWQLALGEDRVLASGRTHQVFRFVGGTWRPAGQLAPTRPTAWHKPAIGDVAWLGQPAGAADHPGTVLGFQLPPTH